MNTHSTFQKTLLVALIVALLAAALPFTSALAAGSGEISNERLENLWQKMLKRYDKVGGMFDNDSKLVERAEEMIARLEQAGESTDELESALEAYQDALKEARPIYESCKGIINSHKGFDSDGKVTDAEDARETVKELGEKFAGIRNAMDGTGKALVELMKSLREEHKPTSASASGS